MAPGVQCQHPRTGQQLVQPTGAADRRRRVVHGADNEHRVGGPGAETASVGVGRRPRPVDARAARPRPRKAHPRCPAGMAVRAEDAGVRARVDAVGTDHPVEARGHGAEAGRSGVRRSLRAAVASDRSLELVQRLGHVGASGATRRTAEPRFEDECVQVFDQMHQQRDEAPVVQREQRQLDHVLVGDSAGLAEVHRPPAQARHDRAPLDVGVPGGGAPSLPDPVALGEGAGQRLPCAVPAAQPGRDQQSTAGVPTTPGPGHWVQHTVDDHRPDPVREQRGIRRTEERAVGDAVVAELS